MARKNLLKGLKRPKNISFEHVEETPEYGRFIAYPFERGYGRTIGNSLRRILMSSIQSYAVVAIRIESYKNGDTVPHVISSEFDLLPDVAEDVSTMVQNLKSLRLKLPEGVEEKTILIEWQGEGELTGAYFEKDGVEVISKDVVICTAMANAKFNIEVQINFGRGYVPAETNESLIDVIGALPVDSLYSPVTRVKVAVEDYRVGHRADYDKLILDIWTDGTILPSDALAEAAKINKEYLSVFINFDESAVEESAEIDEDEQRLRDLLDISVSQLDLSVRSANCLKNAQIVTLRDLTRKTEDDLGKTRNFGKKSLQEIKEKLNEWGLSLAMTDYSEIKERLRLGNSPFKKEE
ncbi:MAG: DNA-directed RNA polymerase subunit alpha [Spirochaetaceae bacterium]|nr:DNA-directed RNA polymerase subunit alpha [Spirochaetaceae bacterium]